MANGNGHRSSGRVSETRFSLLEARVAGIEASLSTLTSKLDAWMTSRTQSPWKVFGLLSAILVPLAFIMNLYITAAISPWAAVANQAKSASDSNTQIVTTLVRDMGEVKSQNADSKRDRDDKGVILLKLSDGFATLAKEQAAQNAERLANETEFETQIDSMAQEVNTQFANNERWKGGVQDALHEMDAKFPPAPHGPWFFPNISNRARRAGKLQ